jgi:hypothetical protein
LEGTSRNEWARLAAIQVLDRIDKAAAGVVDALECAGDDPNEYVVRVAEHALVPFADAGRPKPPL